MSNFISHSITQHDEHGNDFEEAQGYSGRNNTSEEAQDLGIHARPELVRCTSDQQDEGRHQSTVTSMFVYECPSLLDCRTGIDAIGFDCDNTNQPITHYSSEDQVRGYCGSDSTESEIPLFAPRSGLRMIRLYDENDDVIWSCRYKHDKLHCDEGPAVTHINGLQVFYQNGFIHKDFGPAVIRSNGSIEYWTMGTKTYTLSYRI